MRVRHSILAFCGAAAAMRGQQQAVSPDDLTSERALAKFQTICEAQGKALWGMSLCGPVAIVNPKTRWTVASERDAEGKFEKRGSVYIGLMPSEILVSNTAVDWGGKKWAEIISPLPLDPYSRLNLVTHEAFHRIQEAAGLMGSDQPEAHLDTDTGRLWLRLELRALARALRSENDQEMRKAVANALLFRERRYALHNGAREREAAMERQEGLAEYTGTVVALKDTSEWIGRLARRVEAFEDSDAYARSFAYVTGPALGVLLDRMSTGWRAKVRGGASLESELIAAARFKVPADLTAAAETAAVHYGFVAVAAAEHEREARHQLLLDSLTKKFVDGPTLSFARTDKLYRSFNPNELVPFGAQGTYYPTGVFTAPWGKLQVESVGAILASDNMSVRVASPSDLNAKPIEGPGWTLELAAGWIIRPVAGRAGSFEVVSEASGGSAVRQ
jgi:hypothetical protein